MAVETFSSKAKITAKPCGLQSMLERERRFYFARLQVECMRGLMGTCFDCHPDESGRANRRSRDGRSAECNAGIENPGAGADLVVYHRRVEGSP